MTGTWAGTGWDQRAVALVELRGTTTDSDLFEEALAARGWPVLERRAGPVSATVDRLGWYTVELRYPGSTWRAVTGARERIEALADDLRLNLVVEAVDLVVREPDDRQVWHAVRASMPHALVLRLFGPPRGRLGRLRALGLVDRYPGDTGRQIRADATGVARHLAARPLPGSRPSPVGVQVRPAADRSGIGFGGSRMARSVHVAAALGFILGAMGGLALTRWLTPVPPETPGVLLVAGAAAGAAGERAARLGAPAVLLAVTLALLPAGLGAALVVAVPAHEPAARVVVGIALAYLVVGGLSLLVRQASWRAVVPWLLPALLPFIPGLLPALGLSMPAIYLDAFGVALEDVDVGQVPRLAASLRLLGAISLWLAAPAVLGVLKHCHLMIRARWQGYLIFAFCSLYAVVLVAQVAVAPALRAGREARAAAEAGRTPAPYYGVEPEWVCAGTVRSLAQVPVEGGVLDPSRAYLLVGDAGGTAVLWDRHQKAPLKVPLTSLRLVPAGDPRRTCP